MLIKMRALVKGFMQEETGATAIEYGLIAALISVAIIAGASALGGNLGNTFNHLSSCMASANANGSAC